ncbi:MAG: TetR/AcrR family transcriptional regulator [Pyrinomonadaceae bacterium MAG19_C2-C3]|nr:TetR/AcrR family transcriptional regulator [Pyrinomonadaceae bacterium MAG19_C2-C3]
MPKLSADVIETNKCRIETAAKELFITRGFHATSMRDIAARADTSLGNLYNYYRTKEGILESIIARYQTTIDARLQEMFADVDRPFDAATLKRFGRSIKSMVDEHKDYWLLMYIDVLEFENSHFRKMFVGLSTKLRKQFASEFGELKAEGSLVEGVDPAFGFTAVYMQFFSYFLVEKLFGGNRHFGISDEQVIDKLADIYCRGVLNADGYANMVAAHVPKNRSPRST